MKTDKKLNVVEKMHRRISQELLKDETEATWVGPIFCLFFRRNGALEADGREWVCTPEM